MCEPITLWMILTLIPSAVVAFIVMEWLHRRADEKYPELIRDSHHRHLAKTVSIVPTIAVGLTAWGLLFSFACG